MAIYAFSHEGVSNLRKLASDLKRFNSDLETNNQELRSKVSYYSSDLGVFEERINDLITQVTLTQTKGQNAVSFLVKEVTRLAQEIEDNLP